MPKFKVTVQVVVEVEADNGNVAMDVVKSNMPDSEGMGVSDDGHYNWKTLSGKIMKISG